MAINCAAKERFSNFDGAAFNWHCCRPLFIGKIFFRTRWRQNSIIFGASATDGWLNGRMMDGGNFKIENMGFGQKCILFIIKNNR